MRLNTLRCVAAAAALASSLAAHADIRIGVVLSLTGPGASLGIPEDQALRLWTAGELAGEKLTLVTLDDNSDSSTAAKNAARLISEDKVDLIIGSSLTPPSLAIVEAAGAAQVPVITLSGGSATVLPQEGPRKWVFKLSPTEAVATDKVMDHLARRGGKTMGTIGIATSYGDGFLAAAQKSAGTHNIKVVDSEKYNQTDQSVTAQVLKLVAARPDAVYIFSAGTPGALPHVDLVGRGYAGAIYQTQGVANNDFLRVGGKALEGGFATVSPVLVAEQLPDANPIKKVAVDFVQRYEGAHGKGSVSAFAASAWDALLMAQAGAKEALKKSKPGTPQFRAALRDALEGLHDFVGAEAVYNMSDKDHNGVDARSQELVRIEGGRWKLLR
jgi:branched-chain amino acid transport system substrate-binding protein